MSDTEKYSVVLEGDKSLTWDCEGTATSYTINTREIGKEDIYWDTEGTGETGSFVDHNEQEWTLTAINASHIPLPYGLREKAGGATNLADALENIYVQVDSINDTVTAIMTGDTDFEFDSSMSLEDIQSQIDSTAKNLGGNTATFKFAEGVNKYFINPLNVAGFYNGELVIDLNGITIYDAGSIGSLFTLSDNLCSVRIINGGMTYTKSNYAVVAERCPQVAFEDLTFTGSSEDDCYAGNFTNSDGVIKDCTFSSTQDLLMDCDIVTYLNGEYAPIDSPAFTGTPTSQDTGLDLSIDDDALVTAGWVRKILRSENLFGGTAHLPVSLGDSDQYNDDGWIRLGSILIQFGRVQGVELTPKTHTFPVAFDDPPFLMLGQSLYGGGHDYTNGHYFTSISATGFTYNTMAESTGVICWLAMGTLPAELLGDGEATVEEDSE